MSTEAQKAKDKGNAAFRAANYPEAVGHYTKAMLADSADPTYPLNRAAAYLRLGKAIDAERDCSTVLRLSPGHVKALYRRAQARAEIGKLSDAKADLLEATQKEPGNSAVKSELQRVDSLLSEPEKIKAPPIDVENNAQQSPQRRRRVPIEIVEADSSMTKDMLTPISSRSLKTKPEHALPTPLPSPAREPPPSLTPVITPEPSGANPAVRGGIFRASGEHSLFRTLETSRPAPTPSGSQSKSLNVKGDGDVPQASPLSLSEFTRTWESASPSERWELLCKIPPQALPSLFKTLLEAPLLVQILEVCSLAVKSTDDSSTKTLVRDYLRWFPRVPRFSTVTLFLSKNEKELSKTLAEAVAAPEWKL